jgi:hypothetical protein
MTIWEKAVLNMQKGVQRISVVASTFSERVKAEVAIVRLRIRIEEIQAQIDGLHRTIGLTIVDLIKSNEMPKSTEDLLKQENIAVSLIELAERKKELEDLEIEMKTEQDAFTPVTKLPEDTTL